MIRNFRRISVMFSILFIALIAGTGCANDKQVMAQAADTHKALEPAVINDPELTNYLQAIGDRIISAAKQADAKHVGVDAHFKEDPQWMFSQNMKFHLVNSKTLNAFTTGGEHMYIYNALFQACKSEDELAAVMAHEYAHVYSRHVEQGQNHQVAVLATGALVGGAAGYALGGSDNRAGAAAAGAGVGAAGGQFVNMGYTRGQENEADKFGFYFYCRAGWDPKHFDDFFKAMIAMGYDKTPEYLSDHPTLANRVENTERRVKELPPDASQWRRPDIADAAKFKQLQARANELAKSLPDDTKLASSQKLLQALPRSCVAPANPDPPDAQQARQQLAQQAQAASNKKQKQGG
jgi:predicted Zn-dependent protease